MGSQARKQRRIDLRVEERDRELFVLAAEELRESMTQFLVESGRERAERLLADRTRFSVDDKGWRKLQAALDRPAQVKPELVELFSRGRPQ
jgi:uncharacterized protein (DUF1778 family)